MTLSDIIKRATLYKAYEFLDRDPATNFPKLLDWLEKLDHGGSIARQLSVLKSIANIPDSNWRQLIDSLWTDVDDEVRKILFTNVVINACVLASPKLSENRKRYQCNIPWTVQLELTSPYGVELSFDELDVIIEEGKELGICIYILTGSPEGRREDLIALCNKHSDCEFLAVAEPAGIDEPFAEEMLRIKNLIPVLKLSGPNADCSAAHLREATEILRKNRLLYGALCICERKNTQTLSSELFFNGLVTLGAKFVGLISYVPVGRNGDSWRMITPEQREHLYRNIRAFRLTKPIFSIDFRGDGEFVNGCIGGGRRYCCINAAGDVEPCEQVRYSDSNIHEKSLLEAFRSPLFMAFNGRQPFCNNMFRSCPVMEVPDQLEEMGSLLPLRSTDPDGEEQAEILCRKCRGYADAWTPVADQLWKERLDMVASKGERVRKRGNNP